MTKHPAFITAVVITLTWLSLVYWWLAHSELAHPTDCTFAHAYCALRELELNAAGDFLAGIFSVLAFLWLATAVLLQGSELERQRMEFMASRLEMVKQTEMLAQSVDIQGRLIEDDRLIQNVRELLVSFSELWPKHIVVVDKNMKAQKISLPMAIRDISSHEKIEAAFHDYTHQLRMVVDPIVKHQGKIDSSSTPQTLLQTNLIVQLKARKILEKQSEVSSRYLSSRLFTNASIIDNICTLFSNPAYHEDSV